MSLKSFHIFFISTALTFMAFMAYWAGRQALPGFDSANGAMSLISLGGLGLGAAYLVWFLRKSKDL